MTERESALAGSTEPLVFGLSEAVVVGTGGVRVLDTSSFPANVAMSRDGAFPALAAGGSLHIKMNVRDIDFPDLDDWTETEDNNGNTTETNSSGKAVKIMVTFRDGKQQPHIIQPGGSVTVNKDGTKVTVREKAKTQR